MNAEEVYDLPGGWVKKLCKRKIGASAGTWDAYLFAPDGTKLRSNQDLLRYVTQRGMQIDPYVINLDKAKNRGVCGRQKPSKSTISLIQALQKPNGGLDVKKSTAPRPATNGRLEQQEEPKSPRKTEVFRFSIKQSNYLERQYDKLPYPKPREFAYLAKQLKVGLQCVEEWFENRNDPYAGSDSEGKKPMKQFDIIDDTILNDRCEEKVVEEIEDNSFTIEFNNAELDDDEDDDAGVDVGVNDDVDIDE
jgi:hypothetical protein